jgi:tetratricopeptide (TPR) repeat protein
MPTQKDDSIKAGNLVWITRLKMGEAQEVNGNWDEAITWAHKALSVSTKVSYHWGMRRSNWNIGVCLKQKGDYAEAIKYFHAALNAAVKDGAKGAIVASTNNLARCYVALGNYSEALKCFFLGYETQQSLKTDVPVDVRQIAREIEKVYVKMENWDEALNWYQKTLPRDSEIFYAGDLELDLATIQMGMKKYNEALINYRAGVKIFPTRFDHAPEAEVKGIVGDFMYMQLGEAYCKIGTLTKGSERTEAYIEAIKYLELSLPLLKDGSGGKEALMNAYSNLKQACEAINDYQKAMQYTNLYINLKDSMYNKENYLKLVKFETEKAAADMKAKQEIDRIRNEKLLADQGLEQEKKLGEERLAHEKEINDQKLKDARTLAEEKVRSEKSIALEKSKQEKLKAEKHQANNLMLLSLASVIIISAFLFLYLRQKQLKKRAEEKTESVHKMAELEMQSLRSQLNPHFMFNSLNSIQTLILKEDSDKSQSYLARFARLLRMLLENAEKPFVPLQKEIDFLQLYLSLENLRVPDLQYSISTDPAVNTEQTLIPNMILQPYVENAIWHGLSHKEGDKQLEIRINKDNGTVKYEIEDNGVGRKKAEELKSLFRKQHQSKGMELLNKRFKLLNGEYNSSIETNITDVIKSNKVTGTLVTIKVPIQLSISSYN